MVEEKTERVGRSGLGLAFSLGVGREEAAGSRRARGGGFSLLGALLAKAWHMGSAWEAPMSLPVATG